ncbi:MAG: acyltransferase family protein [Planctomycetaceae bacterium]|nr:acyltransferase family protein [Planctomycetaceae bacterium]
MDSMRAVLMMLGVVLHAAYIFSPDTEWVVTDPQSSEFLNVFSHYMRMFRMPAFFVISGFFSIMSLKRYDAGTFLRVRLQRIVIPLISAGLTLNVAQLFYQERVMEGRPTPFLDFLLHVFPQRVLDGGWVQHLWFLNTLVFYFIAAVFIYQLAPPFVEKWKDSRVLDLLRRRCRFMLVLPLLLMGWNVVEHYGHGWADTTLLCGILNLDELAIYFPYFVLGLWLYVDPKLQEEFHHLAPWEAVAAVLSVIVYSRFRGAHGFHAASLLQHYCETLFTLISTQICFIGFRKYADRDSKLFRYLADASYTVYLFHHVCVVILSSLMLQVTMMPELKFLIILSSSLLITLTIHHFLILRIPLLRFMYNGK